MPDALYKPNFQGTTPQGPQGSLSHGTAQALAPAKLLHALVSQCVNARLGLNPQPSPAALPAEGQPLFLPKAPQIYEAAIENPMLGKLGAWLGWLSACPLPDFSFFLLHCCCRGTVLKMPWLVLWLPFPRHPSKLRAFQWQGKAGLAPRIAPACSVANGRAHYLVKFWGVAGKFLHERASCLIRDALDQL